jgi:alpha-tubulin suppressor-like RCC1 family protein
VGARAAAAAPTPVPLPGSTRAVHVCAGAEHALALGSDGSVFAWGENGCGQVTGTEPSRPVKQARSVECFAGQRAVAIAAGKAHSIVLTAG